MIFNIRDIEINRNKNKQRKEANSRIEKASIILEINKISNNGRLAFLDANKIKRVAII